tara:strand:- start:787 stop:936 length:150 start_codon:yes stop_codon:yes gene_type:complete
MNYDKRLFELEKLLANIEINYRDKYLLVNDRINEIFDLLKMLERKINED